MTASNVFHLHTARLAPDGKSSGHILAYCPRHHIALLSDGEVHYESNEGRAEAEAVKEEREAVNKARDEQRVRKRIDLEEQRKREEEAAKEEAGSANASWETPIGPPAMSRLG